MKEIPQEIKDKMKDLSSALFAFNKFDISPKAQTILNDVATWLKKNPQMKCELSGHTDGKGSVAYNQKLSEQRAQAVYDYLVKAGRAYRYQRHCRGTSAQPSRRTPTHSLIP